ncbi:hypothetical protein J7K41_04065 [Candidatus Micrarchaeota archaeon]|nr:hypothetical protein [Candidatus Micrarchaeota archaeon]
MGFIDKLREMFGGKEEKGHGLFQIVTRLEPFRLVARKNDSITLHVWIKNVSDEEHLTSVIVVCPKQLGVNSTLIQKRGEERLGVLKPGEEKEVNFKIYGSTLTPPGEYTVYVVAYSHFKDYEHVKNAARKKVLVRAV